MRLSDLFIALNLALIIHAPIVLLFSPGSGGNRGDLVEIYEVTIEAPGGATRNTQSPPPSPP